MSLSRATRRTGRLCVPAPPDVHFLKLADLSLALQPFYMAPYAAVEGNDVAGYVEKVGEGVTKFKVGDKVAAFTKMRTDDKYGAYAEYSVSPSNTAFHLGRNTSFEDAAALPLAYSTAAIGLFKRLGLSEPDQPGQRDGALLVWGGATTVGVYAIQLAKVPTHLIPDSIIPRPADIAVRPALQKAGYHVVAVAGSSQDVPKSYGADEVLDYRNKSTSSLASEIRQSFNGKGVKYIYDAVSEGTLDVVAEALKDVRDRVTPTSSLTARSSSRRFPQTSTPNGRSARQHTAKTRTLRRSGSTGSERRSRQASSEHRR